MFNYLGKSAKWSITLLVLFCCSISIPTYAGSENVSAKNNKTLLRIMNLPKPMDVGAPSKAGRAIVKGFLKKYPQYKLKPFHMLSIKGGSMDEGPLMAIATGTSPHGIYVNFRQSSTYINHAFLDPIEILLARDLSSNPKTRESDENGNWLEDPTEKEVADALAKIKEKVLPGAWPVVYREPSAKNLGLPPGKHVWALPYGNLARALLYRKDIFKEAGLDPEKPPKDWDELLEYSRKIRALPNKYGFFYGRGPAVSWSIYGFLVSKGVRYMERKEDGKWMAAFNTMPAAEAIYYVLRLTKEKFTVDGKTYTGTAYAPIGGGEAGLKWDRGELAMKTKYLNLDDITDYNPAVTGIAPTPVTPEGKRGNELNCTMMGVFRGGSPQQRLGVLRFLWHKISDESEEIKTKIYVDEGYGKFLNPVVLEKYGYTDILRKIPRGWKDVLELTFKNGVPEPYGKNTQLIYRKVSVPINWALNRPELLELPKEDALKKIKEQLDIAAERVNKFMLGKLTKEEWKKRRMYGGLALFIIFCLFAGSITFVWRAFTDEEKKLGKRPPLRRFAKAYLMILPGLVLVLFIQYLPLLLGTPLALFNYEFVAKTTFVGLDNFATVLYDQRFWLSLSRTFYYVLLVIGFGFWPPILVAILLDEVPTEPLKYFFRTIFYLPTIVSGVILVFLWRQLYEPSEAGFLNQMLLFFNTLGPVMATVVKLFALGCWLSLVGFIFACSIKLKELSWPVRGAVMAFSLALFAATLYPVFMAYVGPSELIIQARGLDPTKVSGWNGLIAYAKGFFGTFHVEPIGWVEDPALAMFCCILPMVWATAGPGCIIYLAALKTVPEDLVEAATIDGAGIIQKLSYITLPRVKFLILINLMGAIVGSFKGGTNFILAMTGGGPNGATRTLGMDIFERSFMELNFGEATAMGWILGAMVIMLTTYQLRKMSQAKFKTGAETSVATKK
ncbi:MAG: extracellular solute-binding protein [Verrucomicrobiota bacterium]|nr:extracellular solute-binding protein [Verrucomicrobiota bacterium]